MDVERMFTYHPPKGDQPKRYGRIREPALGSGNQEPATFLCRQHWAN